MGFCGYLKQSTAVDILLGPFVDEDDGKTAETGLTLDVEVSKNGQALANKTDATTPVHDAAGTVDGYYNCELDATDTGTLGILSVVAHTAGALPVHQTYQVVTANWFDAMCSTDILQSDLIQMGGSAQSGTDLKDFADAGYDPATDKVNGVKLADTTTTNTDMRGTDSAALASVLGALADAAAAGDPTTGDTLMQYIKQLINVLVGTTGVGAFPAAQAPANAINLAEVLRSVYDDTNELQADNTPGTLSTIDGKIDTLVTGTPATKYIGQYGPGIYLDSGAANVNTVTGTDGTVDNPVSTFAAARTIADAIGYNRYYLEGNSDLTLAATHIDWEFCGIGAVADNTLNFGSQDVSRSRFYNLTLEGTQGGASRIEAVECALQDPGAGATTLHIFALRCGLVDAFEIDTSNNNVFDSCYSLAAGATTPLLTATGAAGTLEIRHYSGGIELKALSASHNVSIEGMGQIIFNADCNVNADVSVRGLFSITDNTAGMNSLTQEAVFNRAAVNAEVDTALTDIHLDHLLAANYDPASKPGTATALLNELVEDDGGVSRLTENALEQAPGGAAGDATEAKQDTIIANLSTIRGADSDTLETLSDQIDGVSTTSGAIEWVVTINDGSDGLADADVWITSDEQGANVVASGKTNADGQVTFMLNSGTLYLWTQKSGYDFTNPTTLTVS